jgi:hypothetical protein
MRCRHCSTLSSDTDRDCPGCGRSLGRGLTPAKVGNFTAILFGLLMVTFIVVYTPRPNSLDMATSLTNGLFIGVSVAVGRALGWVVGLCISR